MNNILVIISVIFLISAIITSFLTDNSWKSIGITWGLIAIGGVLFGLGLTL